MPKLNYGCGEMHLDGYINVDAFKNELTKPDVVCDLKTSILPFGNDYFEEVCALHVLEHVERGYWQMFFEEFYRVLVPDGTLMIAYPEFERCAKNFIENYKGNRDFWRMTLYGRQSHPGDYHIVPMRTEEIIQNLNAYGFKDIKYGEEAQEEWSTFLICKKGERLKTRVDLLKSEVFAK